MSISRRGHVTLSYFRVKGHTHIELTLNSPLCQLFVYSVSLSITMANYLNWLRDLLTDWGVGEGCKFARGFLCVCIFCLTGAKCGGICPGDP